MRASIAFTVRFGLLQIEGNFDIRPIPGVWVIPCRIPDSLGDSLATPLRQQLHDGGFAPFEAAKLGLDLSYLAPAQQPVVVLEAIRASVEIAESGAVMYPLRLDLPADALRSFVV